MVAHVGSSSIFMKLINIHEEAGDEVIVCRPGITQERCCYISIQLCLPACLTGWVGGAHSWGGGTGGEGGG